MLLFLIWAVIILIVVIDGNRYFQRQQTKAIIRAIKGPKITLLTQGWRDPLLWKFLMILGVLISLIIFSAYTSHH